MRNNLPHSMSYDRLAGITSSRVLVKMMKSDIRMYLAARRRLAVRK